MGRDDILNRSAKKTIGEKISCYILTFYHTPKSIPNRFRVKNIMPQTLEDNIGSIRTDLELRKIYLSLKA